MSDFMLNLGVSTQRPGLHSTEMSFSKRAAVRVRCDVSSALNGISFSVPPPCKAQGTSKKKKKKQTESREFKSKTMRTALGNANLGT